MTESMAIPHVFPKRLVGPRTYFVRIDGPRDPLIHCWYTVFGNSQGVAGTSWWAHCGGAAVNGGTF